VKGKPLTIQIMNSREDPEGLGFKLGFCSTVLVKTSLNENKKIVSHKKKGNHASTSVVDPYIQCTDPDPALLTKTAPDPEPGFSTT